MLNDPIVIVSAARTPMGGFQGELKGFAAPELGAAAIRAAVERAKIKPEQVEEVIMGCVLPAGQGQAPARQASLGGGLPLATGCTTDQQDVRLGDEGGDARARSPRGGHERHHGRGRHGVDDERARTSCPKARAGLRMGHHQVIDHMFFDGLEDAYDERARLMGTFAEECAGKYAFTREAQDHFAITSLAARAEGEQGRLVRVGDHAARRSRPARTRSSSRTTSSRSRPTSRRSRP